jgi:hypothetical protein
MTGFGDEIVESLTVPWISSQTKDYFFKVVLGLRKRKWPKMGRLTVASDSLYIVLSLVTEGIRNIVNAPPPLPNYGIITPPLLDQKIYKAKQMVTVAIRIITTELYTPGAAVLVNAKFFILLW